MGFVIVGDEGKTIYETVAYELGSDKELIQVNCPAILPEVGKQYKINVLEAKMHEADKTGLSEEAEA